LGRGGRKAEGNANKFVLSFPLFLAEETGKKKKEKEVKNNGRRKKEL
jgi:hypothetical protein